MPTELRGWARAITTVIKRSMLTAAMLGIQTGVKGEVSSPHSRVSDDNDLRPKVAPADPTLTPSRDGSIVSTGGKPPQGPRPAAALRDALRAAYAAFSGPP